MILRALCRRSSQSVSKMAINLGNLIAGILIFIIALIAVCAGLGWYSRR